MSSHNEHPSNDPANDPTNDLDAGLSLTSGIPSAVAPGTEGQAGDYHAINIDDANLVLFNRTRLGNLLRLAVPLVFGMLVQTSMNLIDTAMIGRLDDEAMRKAGVAALGYSLILLWAVGGFLSAISVGTQALTARRVGENRPKAAGKVMFNSLLTGLSTGLLFSVVCSALVPDVFPWLHDNPMVQELGSDYCTIRFYALVAWVGTFSYKSFYDGLGRTYIHLIAAVVMTVINAVLNYILIYGWEGLIEPMHVAGAAWGSTIGTYIGLAIVALWSIRGGFKVFGIYRWRNFDWLIVREILRLSIPSGVATLFLMSGFQFFQTVAGWLDGAEGSANAAATKVIIDVASLSFISCLGLGMATATLVSNALGRGKPLVSQRYAFEAALLAVGPYLLFGVFTFISPTTVMALFTNDVTILDTGADPMRLFGAMTFMVPLALVFPQALFGAGASRFVMVVELSLHLICLVPMSYVFAIVLDGGLIGLWAAAMVYISLLGIITGLKLKGKSWMSIRLAG